MAKITNYTTLVQAIKDVAEDDSNEFDSYIPTAIALAEERLLKELDLPELETQETGTLTASVAFVLKPETRHVVRHFFVTDSTGRRKQVGKRTIDYCYDYWPNITNTDFPKYYADYSDAQYYVCPTPDDNYAYEMRYISIPTPLSSSNSTNYFVTQQCVNALYAAAMVEMSIFMKSWNTLPAWKDKYNEAAAGWNYHAQRQRRDGSIIPTNPEGGLNSLKHNIENNNA